MGVHLASLHSLPELLGLLVVRGHYVLGVEEVLLGLLVVRGLVNSLL